MAYIVKCLLCEKDLTFDRSDPSLLWTHIEIEHPLLNANQNNKSCERELKVKRIVEKYFEKNLTDCVEKSCQTEILVKESFIGERKMDTEQDIPKKSVESAVNDEEDRRNLSQKIVNRFESLRKSDDRRSSKKSGNVEKREESGENSKQKRDERISHQSKNKVSEIYRNESKISPERSHQRSTVSKRKSTKSQSNESPGSDSSTQSDNFKTPLREPPSKPPRAIASQMKKKLFSFNKSPGNETEPLLDKDEAKRTREPGDSREYFLEKVITTSDKNEKVLYKREYKPMEPLKQDKSVLKGKKSSSQSKKTKRYKTSIEKWRPGGSKIICPNCGIKKRPIIKSHTSRVANTALGASLLLTCWPFCFSPCMFPPPREECLHCAVCNYYLGMYDHRKEVITPNPDVTDVE